MRNEVKFFADNGVSGIWNDMNEIATQGAKMPTNIIYDYDGKKASNLEGHNVYALEWHAQVMKAQNLLLVMKGHLYLQEQGMQDYNVMPQFGRGDNRSEDSHM
ncbi:MAG: TIM-barrel domain-containing protein [Ferruginibacter sp.]